MVNQAAIINLKKFEKTFLLLAARGGSFRFSVALVNGLGDFGPLQRLYNKIIPLISCLASDYVSILGTLSISTSLSLFSAFR